MSIKSRGPRPKGKLSAKGKRNAMRRWPPSSSSVESLAGATSTDCFHQAGSRSCPALCLASPPQAGCMCARRWCSRPLHLSQQIGAKPSKTEVHDLCRFPGGPPTQSQDTFRCLNTMVSNRMRMCFLVCFLHAYIFGGCQPGDSSKTHGSSSCIIRHGMPRSGVLLSNFVALSPVSQDPAP